MTKSRYRPLKAYLFRDKDPVIDELRTMMQDHFDGTGRDASLKNGMREIADTGGPTTSPMHAWFFGKTRRPQSATVEAAGRAMGFKREWKRM